MRISDWSSEVCSSDLSLDGLGKPSGAAQRLSDRTSRICRQLCGAQPFGFPAAGLLAHLQRVGLGTVRPALAPRMGARKSDVYGKRVSVRVDLGGRRSIKKKKNEHKDSDVEIDT